MLRRAIAAVALAAAIVGIPARNAAAVVYGEYEVKAAFLLNFARLVQWPASSFRDPEEPIVLGVLGSDPFEGALEALVAGRKVGPRTVEVKRISHVRQIKTCHMVFVASPEPAPLDDILAAARGASVLLVGDGQDFARRGGAINFYHDEGKVRFAINRQAAEDAGLKISSRMLRLAKLVPENSSAAPDGMSVPVASAPGETDAGAWAEAPTPDRDDATAPPASIGLKL